MKIKKTVSMLLVTGMMLSTGNYLQTSANNSLMESEDAALAYVLNELGISDFDAYVDRLSENGLRNSEYDPNDFVDICTTDESNGRIDALDADYLTMVLNGTINYPYDYSDLDATGDYVVDKGDAMEYLNCFIYNIVMGNDPTFTPSSHGSTREVVQTFETRRYVKHNYYHSGSSTPDYTNTYDTDYYLTLSDLPDTSQSNTIMSLINSRNEETPPQRTPVEASDSRIVRNGGTGFIIGKHLIATCAHAVYHSGTHDYSSDAFYLSTVDGEIDTQHQLTPLSVHIPYKYITGEQADFDYALVYVAEDLSAYGKFDCAFYMDNILQQTSVPVVLRGFMSQYHIYGSSNQVVLGEISTYLSEFNEYVQLISEVCPGNCSGSPQILPDTYNGYESVLGITISVTGYQTYGVRLSPTIIYFLYNNPYLVQDPT